MVKAVVHRSGINQVAQAELTDSAQPLHPRVVQDLGEVGVAQLDEPIHRVIEQLGSCSHARNLGSFFARGSRSDKIIASNGH